MNCDQEKLAEKFIKKYKLDRNQHVEILDADDELIVRRVATLSLNKPDVYKMTVAEALAEEPNRDAWSTQHGTMSASVTLDPDVYGSASNVQRDYDHNVCFIVHTEIGYIR